MNTAIAGGVAMVVWLIWAWLFEDKPSFSGVLVGAVAGLAAITPTAGFVEPWAAIVIGALGATVCYFAKYVQEKFHFDDALEVWRAHGAGGVTGSLLVGFFATRTINDVSGGWRQFLVQLFGVTLVSVYAFVITWIIMKLVHRPRVQPTLESTGLDMAELDEVAYHFDKG